MPTEITGFVGADASQFFVHFAGATDRDDPAWKTALDYDPLAVCQLLVNFADDWEWATLDDYSNAAQQLFWQDQGNWRFMTTTGYDDTDATQLLGHINGAWQWKPDRRPTAIDLDTNGNNLRIRLTLSDATVLSDELSIATILNALASYTAGNDQSIGHDASGSTLWQDDEDECPA